MNYVRIRTYVRARTWLPTGSSEKCKHKCLQIILSPNHNSEHHNPNHKHDPTMTYTELPAAY